MNVLAAIGALSTVGLAITVAIMRIRMKGLKHEKRLAIKNEKIAVAAAKVAGEELRKFSARAEAKEATLIRELERYEKHELDAIEEEPNRDARIRRRRDWVAGVLSEATNDPS